MLYLLHARDTIEEEKGEHAGADTKGTCDDACSSQGLRVDAVLGRVSVSSMLLVHTTDEVDCVFVLWSIGTFVSFYRLRLSPRVWCRSVSVNVWRGRSRSHGHSEPSAPQNGWCR